MALVIPAMAVLHARRAPAGDRHTTARASVFRLLPLFVLGFVALAVIRSVGDAWVSGGGRAFGVWDGAAWKATHGLVRDWASSLLVVALAGVGLNTSLRVLKVLGGGPFFVGLGAALAVGALSTLAILLLGPAMGI